MHFRLVMGMVYIKIGKLILSFSITKLGNCLFLNRLERSQKSVSLLRCNTELVTEIKFTVEDVDPEKEYTYQKGLLVVYRDKIHNQSLASIFYRDLSCTLNIKEKPQMKMKLPTCLHCRPAVWANPYKKYEIIFWPMSWDLPCPIRAAQLYLHLYLYQPIRVAL